MLWFGNRLQKIVGRHEPGVQPLPGSSVTAVFDEGFTQAFGSCTAAVHDIGRMVGSISFYSALVTRPVSFSFTEHMHIFDVFFRSSSC